LPEPQSPRALGSQEQPPSSESTARILTGDAAIIFLPVKPGMVEEFEGVMAKLKEAIELTSDPIRKKQAIGWRIFKALEPGPNNTVLYVFVIDPVAGGTNYAFWKTIYDAFPEEAKDLHRTYAAAMASGQTLLTLRIIQNLGPQQP
jgi:hypothetical protein